MNCVSLLRLGNTFFVKNLCNISVMSSKLLINSSNSYWLRVCSLLYEYFSYFFVNISLICFFHLGFFLLSPIFFRNEIYIIDVYI